MTLLDMDQADHSEPSRFIAALPTIRSLASTIPEETLDNKGSRSQLLEAAKDLVLALERPDDVVERVCFQVSLYQCILISSGSASDDDVRLEAHRDHRNPHSS